MVQQNHPTAARNSLASLRTSALLSRLDSLASVSKGGAGSSAISMFRNAWRDESREVGRSSYDCFYLHHLLADLVHPFDFVLLKPTRVLV